MTRDYKAAIEALNTLQPNYAAIEALKTTGPKLNTVSLVETAEYLHRIGYETKDLDRLNPIHVAGTKGKGSTAAFISSILCRYALSSHANVPKKIGLYTSPHLMSARERIRIDHEPLAEDKFVRYFFEVWDRLEQYAERHGPFRHELLPPQGDTKPIYFKFMTIMACHVYLQEGVDTAIFECGIGGEYDATNILDAPTVCAITSLGIDHVAMLGDTIESIAWHKAGIFKRGARCRLGYTVDSQLGAAKEVLKTRAAEKDMALECIPVHDGIANGNITLGLAAEFQKMNASLAIAVVRAHLRVLGASEEVLRSSVATASHDLPLEIVRGLEGARWGGRCETRREEGLMWHIDGGHTVESIKLAAEWFASCLATRPDQRRVLLFNQQTRDSTVLTRALHEALTAAMVPGLLTSQDVKDQPLFDAAIFSTNVTFAASKDGKGGAAFYKPDLVSMNVSGTDVSALTVQRQLAQAWGTLDARSSVEVAPTIQNAVERIRSIAADGASAGTRSRDVVVFATGSLHLVGGLLEVLEATGLTPPKQH